MAPDISPRRRYAEEAAVVLEGMGLPRSYGKLLGWLLVCDPPQQSSGQLAEALGLSRGSVSTGTRMLQSSGLIRRVAVPGQRGTYFEMTPDAIMRAVDADRFRIFRELMERGLAVVGGEHAPGAERLRMTRDFYAMVEREVPRLVERFRREHRLGDHRTDTTAGEAEEGEGDG